MVPWRASLPSTEVVDVSFCNRTNYVARLLHVLHLLVLGNELRKAHTNELSCSVPASLPFGQRYHRGTPHAERNRRNKFMSGDTTTLETRATAASMACCVRLNLSRMFLVAWLFGPVALCFKAHFVGLVVSHSLFCMSDALACQVRWRVNVNMAQRCGVLLCSEDAP